MTLPLPRIFLAAAHKSSGKTTVAIGLAAALRGRGRRVRMFKKGPDYIDPLWHRLASGRDSYNLDFNTQQPEEILDLFARKGADADICLVEANKGLYDGIDLEGRDSNAALAEMLDAPVVLVIDTEGMTRGIAPLLIGYQAFGKGLRIAMQSAAEIGTVSLSAPALAITNVPAGETFQVDGGSVRGIVASQCAGTIEDDRAAAGRERHHGEQRGSGFHSVQPFL